MNTWALNDDNDLELTRTVQLVQNEDGTFEEKQGWIIKMNENLQALKTRIDAALQIVKGELSDESMGVDYFGIIFANTPISMKVQEISRVISSIEGVSNVTFENAEIDRRSSSYIFHFTIESVFGEFEYNKQFVNPAQ